MVIKFNVVERSYLLIEQKLSLVIKETNKKKINGHIKKTKKKLDMYKDMMSSYRDLNLRSRRGILSYTMLFRGQNVGAVCARANNVTRECIRTAIKQTKKWNKKSSRAKGPESAACSRHNESFANCSRDDNPRMQDRPVPP